MPATAVTPERYSDVQNQLIDAVTERDRLRYDAQLWRNRVQAALTYIESEPLPDRKTLLNLLGF